MMLRTLSATVLALCALWGCESATTSWNEPPDASGPTDSSLVRARRDEKLADDTERALALRWPAVATVMSETELPLRSLEDVLRERGLADLEGGFAQGEFSDPPTRRLYFAALLMGWSTEAGALRVAARVEARKMESLEAARTELPDVEGRLTLDTLARASSHRLHGFCQRLAALSQLCPGAGPVLPTLSPLEGPNS